MDICLLGYRLRKPPWHQIKLRVSYIVIIFRRSILFKTIWYFEYCIYFQYFHFTIVSHSSRLNRMCLLFPASTAMLQPGSALLPWVFIISPTKQSGMLYHISFVVLHIAIFWLPYHILIRTRHSSYSSNASTWWMDPAGMHHRRLPLSYMAMATIDNCGTSHHNGSISNLIMSLNLIRWNHWLAYDIIKIPCMPPN